jgi:putative transposase
MAKKYIVTLTEEERAFLQDMIHQGTCGVRKINRAHLLLLADEGESDEAIAEGLHTSLATVQRTRQRFVEEGFNQALTEHRRRGASVKLTGRQEAFLIALACSDPPTGRTRWTMELLTDRLIALRMGESISDETVRLRLKKTRSNRGNANSGIFRREGRSLSGAWKMCLICTNRSIIRSFPWCVLMRPPIS